MIKALEALNRLETGNSRFLSEPRKHRPRDEQRFAEMAESQEPFAIILGCSDSRVPAEIVFVITSYSIHYTKLYEGCPRLPEQE